MITNNVIAVDEESNVFNHDNKDKKDQNNRKNSNHQIYLKMFFCVQDHPYFKRIWLIKHILDYNSPLLKPYIRKQILHNNNKWLYNKYNKAEDIRNCLSFNQILVSLNGISNVSASGVYAQKI